MSRPIVIDSGVLLKCYVSEDDSAEARQLHDQFTAGTIDLVAPAFLQVEVANILWKKARNLEIPKGDVPILFGSMMNTAIQFVPDADLLPAALDLATQFNRTVYDSLYLALSERESCPFVTADERLVNAVAPPLTGPTTLAAWAAAPPPPAGPTP